MPGIDRGRVNASNTVLALDDMNIRGRQIVDAYEYAGKSVELMLNCIDSRSQKMVDYINQKTAGRYLEDEGVHYQETDRLGRVRYPIAVTSGASMAHDSRFVPDRNADRNWYVNTFEAEYMAGAGIEPIQVDFSTLDVIEGITMEEGFKIIEAHGFEKYFERDLKTVLGG